MESSVEHEIQPETFKKCKTALLALSTRGRSHEREHRQSVVRAHRMMLSIIHDLSSAHPSAETTRLTGKVKRTLKEIYPKRDFFLREAILAELAFICETLAYIKFDKQIEDVVRQGNSRISEAIQFCIAFADELAMRRTRTKRPSKRRRVLRKKK